jgi:NAD(P)-dependent dehydrogenase (short-subunit alcohol dehydrogenase family)
MQFIYNLHLAVLASTRQKPESPKGMTLTNMLEDKVAVVTGAAQGIGRGIALMFAVEGAKVAVVDLDASGARAVADDIRSNGGEAIAVTCNVGNRPEVDDTVDATIQAFGHIDILVNTAISGCPRVPLLETTEQLAETLWRSGPLGTMHFIQACHPFMKGRDGKVINFASGAGLNGDIGYAAYGPAKEGIRSLTKVAARELGPDQIRVNAIFPAAKTRLMEAWIDEDPDGAAAVEAAIPLRRFGDPDVDIPLAAVFLASDYSRYVTGHTLSVDGGSCKF